ncbi:hypothetical protein B0H13DRAFT_1852114 [Mycena leptocephala]|nr:hypothetical protein B0H13DRAFT_1852114 [Mycena leptocephala]
MSAEPNGAGPPRCGSATHSRCGTPHSSAAHLVNPRHIIVKCDTPGGTSTALSPGGDAAFRYITSADPSPDLLPLVHSLNPDFFFGSWVKKDVAKVLLDWLKKFNPVPEGLIQLWEDYRFMKLCDEAWKRTKSTTEQQSDTCLGILAQTSPQLIRILYAYRVLSTATKGLRKQWFLFRIHFCLGLSWEELTVAICPLRRLLGGDKARLRTLLGAFTSDHSFSGRVDSDYIFLELATGTLRFIPAAMNCREQSWLKIAPAFTGRNHHFGEPKDLHNAVQWLKVTL